VSGLHARIMQCRGGLAGMLKLPLGPMAAPPSGTGAASAPAAPASAAPVCYSGSWQNVMLSDGVAR